MKELEDWKVESRWQRFSNMGAKYLGLIFFFLFLSSAMAYLGSSTYRFGKRSDLVEKVAIGD